MDDTYNNPDIYNDINTSHVIDEVFQFALAIRKITKSNGFLKFFNQLELSVKLMIKLFYIYRYTVVFKTLVNGLERIARKPILEVLQMTVYLL